MKPFLMLTDDKGCGVLINIESIACITKHAIWTTHEETYSKITLDNNKEIIVKESINQITDTLKHIYNL